PSDGWNETTDRKRGYFDVAWGTPGSWDEAIIQGPHLHVATPIYKIPNWTMKNNQDWSFTDFESLLVDAIPATSFKPTGSWERYEAGYTHWNSEPAKKHYRVAWRTMAANGNERTLFAALIPPGAAHVDGVFSAGFPEEKSETLCIVSGFLASLLVD